jgi:hypothetical protein
MLKKILYLLLVLLSISLNVGSAAERNEEGIPSSSELSKIRLGMSENQVYELIGESTDYKVHLNIQACCILPLLTGGSTDTIKYYKGKGRITFNGVGRVIDIKYDPAEKGYR